MVDLGSPGPEGKQYRIAGYVVLAKIGEGGMGVVLKARQISLDRIVALKILPPKLTNDARFVERFGREARAIAKLSHPNIVRIYEVDRSKGGIHYYAMEYVDGESLGSLLKRQGRLPIPDATRIILQVTQALDHAHAQGFVHRDVKPDNVLLNRQGEAKLADLGLARSLQEGAATPGPEMDKSLTANAVVGTPYYMSPEQAEGKAVDARSDLYALGATFYHLLAGKPPFVGETTVAVITKHLTDPRPDIRQVRPEVPETLSRVIGRLMRIDARERYPDAKALQADLAAWMEEGKRVRPRPSRGLKKPIAVGAAVGLLSLVSGLFLVKAQADARLEREARHLLDAAQEERQAFSAQGTFKEKVEALRRCSALSRSVSVRYPETEAAEPAVLLDQEVRGVLGVLYREEVADLSRRTSALMGKRPLSPEPFTALREAVDALDGIRKSPDLPPDVAANAEAASNQARASVAERLSEREAVATLGSLLMRRTGAARAREVLTALRDFVPQDTPAHRHIDAELRLIDLRARKK